MQQLKLRVARFMANKTPGDYLLSSVKNSLRILNSFSIDQPELRVSDLADKLEIGRSTVSRLLSTLASEGYVMKDPDTKKYRLGLRILTLNRFLKILSKIQGRPHTLP
ncbi:helix-turn-helix domain-containing protein [Paenibacillus periandrae]|uniref:helix-turn-helix domain-containing protein n=1 Tax=Paenibacillus periandrae TaxID=1761741 RepID=UPI00308432A4